MGKARFFCDCGKEIWQDMSREDRELLTIAAAEDGCRCADCFLGEVRARRSASHPQPGEREEEMEWEQELRRLGIPNGIGVRTDEMIRAIESKSEEGE